MLAYTLLHLLLEMCSRWLLLLAALLKPCNIGVYPLVYLSIELELIFVLAY